MKNDPIFAFSVAAASPCIDLPAGGNMWPFMGAGRDRTLGSVFQVMESLYCYNTVKSIFKNMNTKMSQNTFSFNKKERYLPTLQLFPLCGI